MELRSLFLRVRFVDRNLLYDLLERISPSARPNTKYADTWVNNAFKQFRRWKSKLIKNIFNYFDKNLKNVAELDQGKFKYFKNI